MHTMMMRYHNKLATSLQEVNPHWDDETVYQETRHIMVALLHHITYTEFLPVVLGRSTMDKYSLQISPRVSFKLNLV